MYSKLVEKQIRNNYNSDQANDILNPEKYTVLTESELMEFIKGGFNEFSEGFDVLDFMDFIDVYDLQWYKLHDNFESLFYKFIESDHGIYYDLENCDTLFSNLVTEQNLYIVKLKENR